VLAVTVVQGLVNALVDARLACVQQHFRKRRRVVIVFADGTAMVAAIVVDVVVDTYTLAIGVARSIPTTRVLARAKRGTLHGRICLKRDIWKHVPLALVASFLDHLVQLQIILISFFEVHGPCQPVQIGTGLAGTAIQA